MAGSEKLYLQPILKDLLDGLSTTMGSIDGIVDGLGEAVGQMKEAVDDVSEIVTTVSETLTTTNEKLDTANNNIAENREIVLIPDGAFDYDSMIDACSLSLEISGDFNRYDQGDLIADFMTIYNGSVSLTGQAKGTSGIKANNPGIIVKDVLTGITQKIVGNLPINADGFGCYVAVEPGHRYQILVDTNGASGEDAIIYTMQLMTEVFYKTPGNSVTSTFFLLPDEGE